MHLHCIKFNKKSKRFFNFSITFFRHFSGMYLYEKTAQKAAGFYACGFAENKVTRQLMSPGQEHKVTRRFMPPG